MFYLPILYFLTISSLSLIFHYPFSISFPSFFLSIPLPSLNLTAFYLFLLSFFPFSYIYHSLILPPFPIFFPSPFSLSQTFLVKSYLILPSLPSSPFSSLSSLSRIFIFTVTSPPFPVSFPLPLLFFQSFPLPLFPPLFFLFFFLSFFPYYHWAASLLLFSHSLH